MSISANAIVVGEGDYGKTGPDTDCPSGYIAIEEQDITLFYHTTSINYYCPDGMVFGESVGSGETTSCLIAEPLGECYMFVPPGKMYTDASGKYGFAGLCAME